MHNKLLSNQMQLIKCNAAKMALLIINKGRERERGGVGESECRRQAMSMKSKQKIVAYFFARTQI